MNIVHFTYSIEPQCFEGKVPSRETLLRLEDAIRELPTVEPPVTHHFSEGVYAREMFIPRGTVLTGKIHRFAHLNVLTQGEISVLTEEGVRRLKAPCVIPSEAGIKRAGYAHTDCRWITIHPTNERDLDKIEAHFIVPDFETLDHERHLLEKQ